MESVIEVQGLTKTYDQIRSVDGVNFQVRKGEIFGFLGPNGAGKTTTVRMLTGIIKPQDGSIRIMGHDIQREPLEAKEHLGVVPETSNAYVDLSAWQNLMLMAGLYGVPSDVSHERAQDLLTEFGLYPRRDDKVKGFSKGMKQRLILAMALINDPELLFLDEPTSGLDVQSSILIRQMLMQLRGKGKTIFLTTHNLEEANQLCDRIAIINHGKIAVIDSPHNLKKMTRKLNTIEVTFSTGVDLAELSRAPGVLEVKDTGEKIVMNTENVNQALSFLTDYAHSRGIQIQSLNTLAPSLEDVFMEFVGGP